MPVLATHSNEDPPIPVREFSLDESTAGPLIPIRWENQGVCTWAILLDGSDDPPVMVDVDSDGTAWQPLAQKFSTYVYTCVWDYRIVMRQPALVQAQNGPLSPQALRALQGLFEERPRTSGWPGSAQYRFAGTQHGVLIWSTEDQQADWFVGAADVTSLESALRLVWDLDGVGESFYDGSGIARVDPGQAQGRNLTGAAADPARRGGIRSNRGSCAAGRSAGLGHEPAESQPMDRAPERLASWRNLIFLILPLFGWAGYRLYRDYQESGGWEQSSIVSTAITVCIFLLIGVGMFWYANRPEREDQP